MKYMCRLEFQYSPEINDVLKKLEVNIGNRLSYEVISENNKICIELKSKDVVALRMAINTILRSLKVALDAREIK